MRFSINSILAVLLGLAVILISSCNDDEGDACTETTWYQDSDGDGLGNPDVTFESCEAPTGFVGNSDDPNDSDETNAS